jgi:molecular chaperone GrpE
MTEEYMSNSGENEHNGNTISSDQPGGVEMENSSPEAGNGREVSEQNGTAADPTAAKENEIEELRNRISELEEENSELKDQYLRKQADFENFRKRMFRDKEDAIKYANTNLLTDIITIIDDFERAIKAGSEAQDVESFRTGIELIEKQFVGLLERKYGLKRFDSEGEEFDPERHEAINMEQSDEHDKAVVLEDYQKGYLLHDRVIRHSKVKVAMPSEGGSGAGNTGNGENPGISEPHNIEKNDGGTE